MDTIYVWPHYLHFEKVGNKQWENKQSKLGVDFLSCASVNPFLPLGDISCFYAVNFI